MKAQKPSSPVQLAVWAGAGSLLTVVGMVCASYSHALRYRLLGGGILSVFWADSLGIVISLIPFVIGFVVVIQAQKKLRAGIKSGLWSDEQLQPLRNCMGHPAWTVLIVLCIVGMLSQAVLSHQAMIGAGYWVSFMLMQGILQLRAIVKPQVAHTESFEGLKDPQNWKSISSEHWGEAPRYNGQSVQS
jgi:hypothetical protein